MGKFSEANLGPLPLLRTLKINSFGTNENDQPITSPPPSFFADAINVEEFTFSSMGFQFHNHFNFPNLTTFSLWTHEVVRSKASDLFNFLKASPLLQTVGINAYTGIMLEDIPQETVVTLLNVETFELLCGSKNVYDVAAHISCPHARDVSLTCEVMDLDMPPVWEIFPTPVPWNKIVHQYTRSPVEEVTLEIRPFYDPCFLTFQTSDAGVIRLVYEVFPPVSHGGERNINSDEIIYEAFRQGFRTIQAHPLLSNVKRLHIKCRDLGLYTYQVPFSVAEIERLFEQVGPLDEFTLGSCDLDPYLTGFGELDYLGKPIVFPHIKEFTISHPTMAADEEECMGAIVKLAKSQHMKGIPFERMTVRMERLPAAMGKRLRWWVGVVDCYEEDSSTED